MIDDILDTKSRRAILHLKYAQRIIPHVIVTPFFKDRALASLSIFSAVNAFSGCCPRRNDLRTRLSQRPRCWMADTIVRSSLHLPLGNLLPLLVTIDVTPAVIKSEDEPSKLHIVYHAITFPVAEQPRSEGCALYVRRMGISVDN